MENDAELTPALRKAREHGNRLDAALRALVLDTNGAHRKTSSDAGVRKRTKKGRKDIVAFLKVEALLKNFVEEVLLEIRKTQKRS